MAKENNKENKENKRVSTFDVEQGIQVQVPNGCFELSEAYGLITRGVRLDSEPANDKVDEVISKKVIPYINSVAIFDVAQLDRRHDRTSLEDGTYNGVSYYHSDTTLSAKYPKLAAALTPIVDNVLSKYSWEINYTNETLIIDAIGCALANSVEGYAEAVMFKRALNVKNKVDEDDLPMAPLFNSNADHGDTKSMCEWSVPIVGYQLDSDNASNRLVVDGQIDTNYEEIKAAHPEFYSYSQAKMDSDINANISRLFVSEKAKALVNLIFGHFIKLRYSDADTDRYLTFVTKSHADINDNGYLTGLDNYTTIVRDTANNVKVLTNRFTFLPEILNAIGAKRLDASSTPDREGKDRVKFDKTGLTLDAVYDDHDFFKNIIDHCAINPTAYRYAVLDPQNANPLTGDVTGSQFIQAYQALMRNYVSTELDSYIGHALEYGDSAILSDEVLNVTANDGVVALYNNYYYIQRNNKSRGAATRAEKMLISSTTHPVNISVSRVQSGASQAQYDDLDGFMVQISVLNQLLLDTKPIDPVFDFTYELGVSSAGGVSLEIDSVAVYYGLNSYVSHSGDMQLIKTYNTTSLFVDMNAINKINDNIAGKNNQSAN